MFLSSLFYVVIYNYIRWLQVFRKLEMTKFLVENLKGLIMKMSTSSLYQLAFVLAIQGFF
jgi:hypothetical protein